MPASQRVLTSPAPSPSSCHQRTNWPQAPLLSLPAREGHLNVCPVSCYERRFEPPVGLRLEPCSRYRAAPPPLPLVSPIDHRVVPQFPRPGTPPLCSGCAGCPKHARVALGLGTAPTPAGAHTIMGRSEPAIHQILPLRKSPRLDAKRSGCSTWGECPQSGMSSRDPSGRRATASCPCE